MTGNGERKKKKSGCLLGILITLGLIVIAIIVLYVSMRSNIKSYENMDFSKLDLSTVEDGTYIGFEDAGLVKVKVEVMVKDHKMSNITILQHDCGTGKPAEVIIEDMVAQNRIDVDGVSGATTSSNVIKTAVFNAMK